MKENLVVYSALRDHILHKEDQISNETIYMYVTYFALLAVGSIWNQWVALATFIDLIVFQSMINGDQWSIIKASIYIKTFFETKSDDIHWESLHTYPYYQSVFGETIRKTVGWNICKRGAEILSVFSFLSILFSELSKCNYSYQNILPGAAIRIALAFFLLLTTIFVNKQYFSLRGNRDMDKKLEQVMDEFYGKAERESSLKIMPADKK